ncbi:uncharacterized protein LOC131314479 isoform X2 [Rhododendron vialii]|uniref:uncharacterized protein LOC131314479 isoform X2 n=1 Tax=Rhododendron vialii TaxID=182163 RepID=UPI00265F230E|nr:uncharacterized protein LOC131314479 isoform X2 [Rhododendron vialii]
MEISSMNKSLRERNRVGGKMVKRKGRRGQKRKSARTKALEASKKAKKESNNNNSSSSPLSTEEERNQDISRDQHNAALSPPLATAAEGMAEAAIGRQQSMPEPRRGRKKKRLDEVAVTSVGPATHQNGEQEKLEVPPVNNVLPSKQRMPEKRILEFVLDILQRRDTHEIFAQPVDQNEVEGYYSIIEEPMDFGTMRAKLQEEIYTTLEQFENDVFLITNNAMLFNSSSTIYFRQARAIHELAKRVFHTLKTEPQKIKLEFSMTRRRYGRKPRGEYGSSSVNLGAKLRVNNLADPHDYDILSGCRDGRNVNYNKTERRQTYAPQYSTVSEEESIVSTVYSSSKQLVPGNGGIGYKESLLRFVEELGPIAQMVARQKLRCLTQTPIPLISSTAPQQRPTCINGVTNTVTAALKNPQGSHDTISKGKNIITSDNTGINSSISRGRMEVEIDRLDIPNARKGVLIGDGMDSYSGPICGETLPCSVNDGLDSHKYMDLGQGAVRGGSGNCSQNIQSQFCSSYLPNDREQPSHSAPIPQPALFEFLSSSSHKRLKSSVYPSTVIRPSVPSQHMALMHGPGRESNAPPDLNCGASSSPVSQPVEWSLPTPWGPQVIVDIHANLLSNKGFMHQEPQLPVDQYWQAKSSRESPLGHDGLPRHQRGPQVASAAPYTQVQPSGANPLGQDAVLQQELLSQSGYTQPQPSLLNLLGQGIFTHLSPLGQDAYAVEGPQLVVPQYVEPQAPNYVNPLGRYGIRSQDTQPGLPHQGVTSDPRYFNERELMKDNQQNSINAGFWNFQQQFLRGATSHHPDLDLRLQTRNRRS